MFTPKSDILTVYQDSENCPRLRANIALSYVLHSIKQRKQFSFLNRYHWR